MCATMAKVHGGMRRAITDRNDRNDEGQLERYKTDSEEGTNAGGRRRDAEGGKYGWRMEAEGMDDDGRGTDGQQ
jgi:hypothetical protein